MTIVQITKIPSLNSVVIKQKEGRLFIAAPDSIIIDRDGLIKLVEELTIMDFISVEDLSEMLARIGFKHED